MAERDRGEKKDFDLISEAEKIARAADSSARRKSYDVIADAQGVADKAYQDNMRGWFHTLPEGKRPAARTRESRDYFTIKIPRPSLVAAEWNRMPEKDKKGFGIIGKVLALGLAAGAVMAWVDQVRKD